MNTKSTVAFVSAVIFQVLAMLWWLLPLYFFLLGPGSRPIHAPGGGGIIERRYARTKATARHAKSTGRIPIILTVSITTIGLCCDYALWQTLSNMDNGIPDMLGIITFAVNAIALVASLIVIVAYRQHLLLRTACAILSLVGLSFAVFIWHVYVM